MNPETLPERFLRSVLALGLLILALPVLLIWAIVGWVSTLIKDGKI